MSSEPLSAILDSQGFKSLSSHQPGHEMLSSWRDEKGKTCVSGKGAQPFPLVLEPISALLPGKIYQNVFLTFR